MMNAELEKKTKSLKSAIDRYDTYKRLTDSYNTNNNLDEYIAFIQESSKTMSESLLEHYNKLIYSYNCGNVEPLLSNLYDRLLDADERKNRLSIELKDLLRDYEINA